MHARLYVLFRSDVCVCVRVVVVVPGLDDKELVKKMIRLGVGRQMNEEFEAAIERASSSPGGGTATLSYNTQSNDGLSLLPPNIASLSSTLLRVDLSKNCLTVLPDAFFALKRLTHINVEQNLLYEVCPRFVAFSELEELNVAENLIESLPTNLIYLSKLRSLTCFGNPISQPPIEVVRDTQQDGTSNLERIMGYFKAVVSSGTVENLNLKVMVLGRSEAGKTSLINAMVERVSRLTRIGDRTVGIEQRDWTVPLKERKRRKNVVLKIFDFAGQDEYCKLLLFLLWSSSTFDLRFPYAVLVADMMCIYILPRLSFVVDAFGPPLPQISRITCT
jgi:hypothetical protein